LVNQSCYPQGVKTNEKKAKLSFQQYVVIRITEVIFTTGIPSLVNLTFIKRFPLSFFSPAAGNSFNAVCYILSIS